jgi:predicted helicase
MACGTGKTMVALWTAERLGARRILVLMPSLALVKQTLEEWSRWTRWGDDYRFMCVCSDPKVAGGVDSWVCAAQVLSRRTGDGKALARSQGLPISITGIVRA